MRQFCPSKMLASANSRKAKGAGVSHLLCLLLTLPFCNLNIWQFTGNQSDGPCRDAFYRFLANASYNWRKLLASVAIAVIAEMDRLTD